MSAGFAHVIVGVTLAKVNVAPGGAVSTFESASVARERTVYETPSVRLLLAKA